MADRPDIDALLISALYGELSPAEEARLSAHLESHPTDRTALADLTRARELVRESRVLQLQLEPPQALSALILQEAARRAPKASTEEREGWFARFVRSFAAHPAMAAAAMLVVVVGVATFVTRREGDHFAQSTAPAITTTSPASERAGASPSPGPNEQVGEGATDQYNVDLLAQSEASKEEAEHQPQREDRPAPTAEPPADKAPRAKGTGTTGGVEVPSTTTAAAQPKELEDVPQAAKKKADAREYAVDRTVARQELGGDSGGAPPGTFAPPPPPRPASVGSTGSAIAEGPRAGAGVSSSAEASAADSALGWAREQHQSVIAQVRAGNCTNAANLAVTLSTRDPGYYTNNVASDRELKTCLAYITNRVAQNTEQRAQRARAKDGEATKRAVEQPAKPSPAKPAAPKSSK